MSDVKKPSELAGAGENREEQATKDSLIFSVNFYYEDGSRYSRTFYSSAKGFVFNLQKNHISLDDTEHERSCVFNLFNLPDSNKIVTVDVLFDDDELPF